MGACPKCGEPINADLVAKASDECRMRFRLSTEDGLFTAKNLGGVLTQVDKLNAAVGKDVGRETITLVEKIEPHENGFEFTLLCVRAPNTKVTR